MKDCLITPGDLTEPRRLPSSVLGRNSVNKQHALFESGSKRGSRHSAKGLWPFELQVFQGRGYPRRCGEPGRGALGPGGCLCGGWLLSTLLGLK